MSDWNALSPCRDVTLPWQRYTCPIVSGYAWMPHRKGTVSGFVVGGFGAGAAVFNAVSIAWLNPSNVSPNPATGYYTKASGVGIDRAQGGAGESSSFTRTASLEHDCVASVPRSNPDRISRNGCRGCTCYLPRAFASWAFPGRRCWPRLLLAAIEVGHILNPSSLAPVVAWPDC